MAEEDRMMFQILQYFTKIMIKNPPVPMRLFVLLLAVLCYGASGFLYFELSNNPELTWLDGLWYTVVTMTTVGYGDFFPKTTGGRFLVGWPVMIFGIGILGYALSVIAAALISSKTKEIRGMSSFALKDHLVIFNYPGLAKLEHLLKELFLDPVFGSHVPIVLVDEFLEELPPELVKRNIHYVRGNPVRDETLARAAIDEARFAIVLSRNEGDTASDNLNVSVTLAVEGRNRGVVTVVEIVDPASEELLRKAGCDKVVCTSRFGAHFLSQELLNPGIQEVIEDLLSAGRGQNMYLVKITRTLDFNEVAKLCGVQKHIALGIHTAKEVLLNPEGSTKLQPGDRVITVGPSRIGAI
jgi:voltage-gated potassium channel